MAMVWRYLEPALVERLNHLQLSARSVVEGSTIGMHKSPMKGASVEFRQHRAYVAGDEPRRLDWRVLARTDRPYIKEYDEETNLRCMVLLDASGSMGYGSQGHGRKFDAAAKITASLAYLMLRQTESVGLATFNRKIDDWVAPHGSSLQLSNIIDRLERCDPQGESHLAHILHEAAERIDRRSLIVVISDFFVPVRQLREGFAHLRHDRHEIMALQVLDPAEEDFPFSTWARFRGLEGEDPMLVEPATLRQMYLDNLNAHRKQLTEDCRSLNVAFHTYRTDRPLGDWLTQLLHRRTLRGA